MLTVVFWHTSVVSLSNPDILLKTIKIAGSGMTGTCDFLYKVEYLSNKNVTFAPEIRIF